MSISKKTHIFSVKHVSEETGDEFEGQFTTKKLSIMDRSKIGVRRSQLSGGMYTVRDDDGKPTGQGLDEDTDFLNHMIAHLEHALVQKPTWFKLEQIDDAAVLRKVYAEVIEFENSFRVRRNVETAATGLGESSASSSGTQPAPQHADAGGVPAKVVGREVQAALDA